MFSYKQIMMRFANFPLSYLLGSKYTRVLHKAVEEYNCKEEKRDLKKIESLIDDDGIYIDMVDYSNMGILPCDGGFSKYKPSEYFSHCVIGGNLELAKGLLGFNCIKDQINEPIYDPKKLTINDRIESRFSTICQQLKYGSNAIDGGISCFFEAENSYKAPILFQAILTANPKMVKLLLENRTNINATVHKISARALINTIFDEEEINNLLGRHAPEYVTDCSPKI